MKLKRSEKPRLVLHKETLQALDNEVLRKAIGEAWTSIVSCPSGCPGAWECYAE